MILAFIVGILFALIAQYARLNSFNTIASAALLRNHDVVQILFFAIAISSVGFVVVYLLGGATISVKPFYVIGVCLGGILFGAGVAILGYCPGTMLMALAEGTADALLGYVGGIAAALLFTLAYPTLLPLIGPDFGAINLYATSAGVTAAIVGVYAVTLLFAAFRLERVANAPSDLIN